MLLSMMELVLRVSLIAGTSNNNNDNNNNNNIIHNKVNSNSNKPATITVRTVVKIAIIITIR